MDENIYQHFRKEEAPFIDQVAGWLQDVSDQYRPYLTDFLDPRQQYIVEALVGEKGEQHYRFDGGYGAAERKRALLYPDYFTPTQDDFAIQLFEIHYPTKFSTLSHGKILGTLVNAGIKREMFGDIMTDGDRWQFCVTANMADYIQTQIVKIGRIGVRLEPKDYTELLVPKDAWVMEHTATSSLRVDSLISSVYNISRQRSKELVENGKIKLNWQEFDRPDFELGLRDIISVRGYGRIQLHEIEGRTKKEKYRLLLGVLRK
ncbi:YlmH family RNA-binding protein [Loigolactobacillus zhaoyuanensis]|uniref:YlmH family RNA-binding protein n=1 Tax=Loigolactobacillus zhaoyuanensis TaxID=2486017 RepID=UPI000F746BD4|nr:RNA-binding protein [Loigolactobacillus zhaoyuanensis]